MLRREGWAVNAKRVRRLMAEMGLKGKAPVRRRTTDSRHDFPRYPNLVEGLEITRPDHVWVADITYVRLREEFVYLAVVMDVFTRRVRGWELGGGLDQGLILAALKPIHSSLGYLAPAKFGRQWLEESSVMASRK
jgi:putative transposase